MQSIINFILEIEQLKGVTRKVKPLGLDRYENSAEHSWHIALAATSLAHLAAEPVDVARVIHMLLLHDLGEIDTGDTIAFNTDGLAERKAAERSAIERLAAHLPQDVAQSFIALWHEFENETSAEARFAHALDRAMPVLLNLHNQGQSWRENAISYERVVARVQPPIETGCPALWAWIAPRLMDAREQGWFGA